jgi:GTPase SAR1 family protein
MNLLQQDKQRKQAVTALLRQTAEYYKKYGNQENSIAMEKLASDTANGKFAITVVGEFSAGKSTFLNALMKDRYLPSFSKETTATVNFLRSIKESPTEKPMIRINYRDKHQETDENVTLKTIEQYVSTNGDNVAQKISSVELFLDSPFLNDGVTLVDSPGLNGIKDGHEAITNQQIKESHAVIYMFSAAQPGSNSDFKVLGNLLKSCNTLFIVLNKIDEIKETEKETVESVVAQLKANFKKMLNVPSPEIWPIAAYPALVARCNCDMDYHGKLQHTPEEKKKYLEKSRIEAYEERLMRFLTQGEKNKKELIEPLNKIEKQLADNCKTLDDDIATLSQDTSSEEIQKQIDALLTETDGLEKRIKKGKSALKNKIYGILRNAGNEIKNDTGEISKRYIEKIGLSQEMDDLAQDSHRYMRHINDEYQTVYETVVKRINDEFANLLIEEFSEYSDQVEQRLNETANKGTNLSIPNISVDLSQFETDVDIDRFLQRREEIYAKIDEIENDKDKTERDIIRIKAQEKAYARLLDQRKELQKERNKRLEELGVRPEATTRTETTYKRRWDWWLIIPSSKIVPETHVVVDRTDQEVWDKRRIEIEGQYDNEISELNDQLKNIPQSSDEAVFLRDKLQRKKDAKEQELKDLEKKMHEEIEKTKANNMYKAKRYLEDIIEEFNNKGRAEIIKQLKEQENLMTETAEFIIRTSLEEELAAKDHELNTLKQQLTSSKEEREKTIEDKKQQKAEAFQIRKQADELLAEIEKIHTDTIKTE